MELFDDDVFTGSGADNETAAALSELDSILEQLDEISPAACDNVLHALLYGYAAHTPSNPPLLAIIRFARKVLAAAETAGGIASEEARRRAERVRADRLDPDTEPVHTAAYKVLREFDRLRGLLRFKPEASRKPEAAGMSKQALTHHAEQPEFRYVARCEPDHFVLPLLADHFWRRFGNASGTQPWAIIDEKRNLALISKAGGKPVLRVWAEGGGSDSRQNADDWEGLWKNYHRSINNENRANPKLQKQFMPQRYWKYLTEME